MPGPSPSPTLRDILMVLFRHHRLFLVTFATLFSAIFLYGLIAPPYKAEMKVLLRHGRVDPKMMALPSAPPQLDRDEVTEEELNSEVELLHDEAILQTVARNADLATGGPLWFWKWLGQTQGMRLERAVRRLEKKLDVEAVRKTDLINVSYSSANPAQGVQILRCLQAAYLQRHSQVHRPPGELSFFEEQLHDARGELERAELRLIDFSRGQGISAAATQRDLEIQKLAEADGNEKDLGVSIQETAERIRSLQAKMQSIPERTTTRIKNLDNPDLMGKLKSKMLDLELNRTDLLMKYGPSYRLVKEAEEQIAETRSLIAAQDKEPLREQTSEPDANHEWTKSELLKAQVELQQLLAGSSATHIAVAGYREAAEQLGEEAIRQQQLESDVKAAEDRYLLYASKREEARIGDALDRGGILNVAVAEEPVVPALPEHSVIFFCVAGFLVAGVTGTAMTFAADYLNPCFRTPDEVVALLGSPVLASLPRSMERGSNHGKAD